MLFNSFAFAVFISLFAVVYYTITNRYRLVCLLLASLVFYMFANPIMIFIPFIIIAISFWSGKQIQKEVSERKQKAILTLAVVVNISILLFYKYIGFFLTSFVQILDWVKPDFANISFHTNPYWITTLAIPLGISYISFQSIGYLLEINRGIIQAEKSILKLSAYLLYFPKLIAGPVERASHFLPQLTRLVEFDYVNVTAGIRQIGWGLFKKLMIADRIGIYVNHVYLDIHQNQGLALLIAVFLYPMQLYCDFSGYTDMALGVSKILGYELKPNFNKPFSSKSMVEFWRKWHISLSTWFNDFFYTPLAIQKRDWGKWAVVFASMCTFLLLGLWHGPNWTFVFFGGIQGILIAIELFTNKQRKKISRRIPAWTNSLFGVCYVYLVFSFSCIYFRSETITDAGYLISHSFSKIENLTSLFVWKETLQNNLLGRIDCIIIAFSLVLMFIVEWKNILDKIPQMPTLLRWAVYYLFIISMFTYGVNSGQNFIYKQF